jgi:transcriptional regulator with AAA-type ATPase domain
MTDTRTTRNDDLSAAKERLVAALKRQSLTYESGWLNPIDAYALYTQFGVIHHVIGRVATLMSQSDWDYLNSDVPDFNWATTQSRAETLKLKSAMRTASIFWMRDGGGAIEWLVDDSGGDRSEPLVKARVRKVRKLKVWSAYNLKPEGGYNYSNAPRFIVRNPDPNGPKHIHRSRLSIVVSSDIPPHAGTGSGTSFINTYTGWPPSLIEGWYRSHKDWRETENDVSEVVHALSILHLAIEGYRKARNGISDKDADAVISMLDEITETLGNGSVLFTDAKDKLSEVGRTTAGLDKISESKKLSFVADVGLPEHWVLMTSAGNLGDDSGPRADAIAYVEGLRTDVLTSVVEETTDLINIGRKRKEALPPEPVNLEIPKEYTTKFQPIDEQSGERAAKQRSDEASAREKDFRSGVDLEVILTDPALSRDYSGMNAWLEAREEARKVTEAAKANQPQVPEDDLVSAAAIAKKLGVKSGKVISMIKSGEIPGIQIGSRWKASMAAAWAAIHGAQKSNASEGEAEDRSDDLTADALGLSTNESFGDCFGASVAMREIFAVLEIVAPSSLPVLITGESGTGKELVARGLHDAWGGDFMPINCGAFESVGDLVAALEPLASRVGTLFLDEVGELSPPAQASVLRILAEAVPRIVSATWRDLRDESRFRLDLYNRLGGVEVEVPPLRDREGDVIELANRFAAKAASNAKIDLPSPAFAPDAVTAMGVYHWPGNVRELAWAVERGALFSALRRPISAEDMQIGGRR